jgi:hypothetical protein
MANLLGYNGGRFYSSLSQPVLIDCNFTVDATNGNGLGLRSLKGSLVKNVFMNTSAAFTGTSHTSNLIDGIASGTASLVVGMPVQGSGIAAGTTILTIASSSSITLSAATSSSTTGSITYQAIGNPNPAAGYALIQLKESYARYAGGFSGFVSPSTGGTIAINSSSLTKGIPYIIAAAGHASAGAVTIAPVADSSGSLSSTWFRLYDAYGNTFIIWFYVTGVGGSAPIGVGGTLVQQTIAENASAATIGTALASTIALLPSGISGVNSFTATGTTTVTATSTNTNPYGPVAGPPADGTIATGFTFANSVFTTNQTAWQKVGLPAGVLPNVGASFIATATGYSTNGGSTGTVVAAGVSGCTGIEVIGDPNQSSAPIPMGGSGNHGAWILVQFIAATSSSVTTPIPTAPAQNTVVGMSFYMEAKSVVISGD